MRRLIPGLLAATFLGAIGEAAAQETPPEKLPIGRFVADVRVAFPKFPDDPAIASGIGVTVPNLPGRAFGLVVGAHFYPVRLGKVTIGFGAEVTAARRGRTLDTGTEDEPAETTVNSRFSALSPQISLNFGSRDGWSYISGGIGWSHLHRRARRRAAPGSGVPVEDDQLRRRRAVVREEAPRAVAGPALLRDQPAGAHEHAARRAAHDDAGVQRRRSAEVAQAASLPRRHSSKSRGALPATECSDGFQPSARARGLRTI